MSNPVTFALSYINLDWAAGLISIGSIVGITTVLLVMLYGTIRLLFAISRDGLLPRVFSTVHPVSQTPIKGGWIAAIIIGFITGFVPLDKLVELTNIGTLFAFAVVAGGVIVMRRKHPDLPRSFKVPFMPYTPIVSIAACCYLMLQLETITWFGFFIWMAIGLIIYFSYGYRNSILGKKNQITPD